MEDRIISLETKLAFAEDSIQELNKTVLSQEKDIQKLRAFCLELQKKLNDLAESDNSDFSADQRPPHY